MLLFINTSQPTNQILIAQNDNIIAYQEFDANRDDLGTTLPKIEAIFTEHNLDKFALKQIVAVSGPGSFIGIRVGLTIANTLLKFIPESLGYSLTQEQLENKKSANEILNICQQVVQKQTGEKKIFPMYGQEPNI